MTAHDILHIKRLDISLRTGEKILNDVDLAIGPGRILGVIGESGAGKSMIGSAIADTLPTALTISRGSIEFDGLTLTDMTPKTRRDLLGRDIGFIPQEPMTALNPSLTIGQQVGRHLARIGIRSPRIREQRAIDLFSEVGLSRPKELLGSYPHQLSGGMMQRVLIAMAFASPPPLAPGDGPRTAPAAPTQHRAGELTARRRRPHTPSVLFTPPALPPPAELCDAAPAL